MSAEQLEAHGAKLCQRPVMALLDGSAAVKAALESGGEAQVTCADWEMTGVCGGGGGGGAGPCTTVLPFTTTVVCAHSAYDAGGR